MSNLLNQSSLQRAQDWAKTAFGGYINPTPQVEVDCRSQGWEFLKYGRSIIDEPLCIGGRVFSSGFGTHADSEIALKLPSRGKRFPCAWEAGGLYKSWLLESDGTYYVFYNAKNLTTGSWFEQTGFATSYDLVHWERFAGNPVLPVGAAGAFDDRFASDPCVLRHGDTWVMFYFGYCSDGHAREGSTTRRDRAR